MAPQKRTRGRMGTSSCQGDDDEDDAASATATASAAAAVAAAASTRCKERTSLLRAFRYLHNKENRSAAVNGESAPKLVKKRRSDVYLENHVPVKPVVMRPGSVSQTSHHITHYLRNLSQGLRPCPEQNLALNAHVVSMAKDLHVHVKWGYFDRRGTTLAWHPRSLTTVVVGTKSGDIFVWNFERDAMPTHMINGTGADGSIQALVFNKSDPDEVYTASVNGTVTRYKDFKNQQVLLHTNNCDHWFTSLDLPMDGRVVLAGDNRGWVNCLTPDDQVAWKIKMHGSKVTHIEFCPRDSNYLVTASVDRTIKVWDIRNIKSPKNFLYSDTHERPINSAYFSRTDGNRILTTDQGSELRVYAFPCLALTKKLPHPHRHFQHITPIKATWHPLRDLIVVGRYPDPNFPGDEKKDLRTIDFFDGDSGDLVHQHFAQPTSNKIVSLNLFSPTGDYLLSAGGTSVWLWRASR